MFSPALMNVMFGLPGGWYLLCWIPVQMMSATAFSTWSWCCLYLLSPRAFGQQLKMCSRDPLARHSGHAGVSASPLQRKFYGLGRTSYTEWIRNLSLAGSDFRGAEQVIFRVNAWSQLVQAPCWCMATILLWRSSSTSAWISLWISCRLSLPWALS